MVLRSVMKLVDAAVFAGADVVKFQTFNSNELSTANAQKPCTKA